MANGDFLNLRLLLLHHHLFDSLKEISFRCEKMKCEKKEVAMKDAASVIGEARQAG